MSPSGLRDVYSVGMTTKTREPHLSTTKVNTLKVSRWQFQTTASILLGLYSVSKVRSNKVNNSLQACYAAHPHRSTCMLLFHSIVKPPHTPPLVSLLCDPTLFLCHSRVVIKYPPPESCARMDCQMDGSERPLYIGGRHRWLWFASTSSLASTCRSTISFLPMEVAVL